MMTTQLLIGIFELQCALLQRNEDWAGRVVTRDGSGKFASESGSPNPQKSNNEKNKAIEALEATKKRLSEIGTALGEMPQEVYERAKNLLNSKNMNKAREDLVSKVSKTDPEVANALSESIDQVKDKINEAETPQQLQESIKEVLPNKKSKKIPEAVALGVETLAAGVLLGPIGIMAYLGGYGAFKNFSIPNFQQKGGKFKQEKFLLKEQEGDGNERDIFGYLNAYQLGAISNLTYNFCVGLLAVGTIGLAIEIADPQLSSELPWKGAIVDLLQDTNEAKKMGEGIDSTKKVAKQAGDTVDSIKQIINWMT